MHADIVWRLADHGRLVADPGLPGRIRGAFGGELVRAASPEARIGEPCPWQPPCAFEVLFRRQGRMDRGFDFPAPWVVLVDTFGADLLVTLRLFGFAVDYCAPAAEAMTAAIIGSVDFRGSNRLFLPMTKIVSRRISTTMTLDGYEPRDGEISIELLSPLAMTGSSPIERPQSLLTTFAARVAGLAHWMDVGLDIDRSILRDQASALKYEWQHVQPITWKRGSARQDKMIPMEGFLGELTILGEDEPLHSAAALLTVAEVCFFGADVAFGCGRFRFL